MRLAPVVGIRTVSPDADTIGYVSFRMLLVFYYLDLLENMRVILLDISALVAYRL